LGLCRIETEKEKSTCLKPRLRIRAEALPPTCSLHLQSINHYITIIPIAIPIIPISPDCGPNAVAEPVAAAEAIAADALLEREETTDAVGVAAADAPDLVSPVAVAGAMVPVVPLGRTRSTPRLLQSATVTVFVFSRSAAEQPFDTSGKRALSQPVLLQIQVRSLRVHWLVLILFKAGAEAHGGISVMDCVEAEVMERASAKMAKWYRMLQASVWDRNRNRGFIR